MADIRDFQGKYPRIVDEGWVDPTAVIIGDVEIGARSSVWPMCVIRGDINHIRIGRETNIQDGSVLHVSHDSRFMPGGAPLVIHDRVTVGHKAVLHGCEIKDLCLVGIGSTILDGAVLEPLTLLGAGTLVPPGRVLESGYLWLGAPARRIRQLSDKEKEYLEYSAAHYANLAATYVR